MIQLFRDKDAGAVSLDDSVPITGTFIVLAAWKRVLALTSRVSPEPRSRKYTPTAWAGARAMRAVICARSESSDCAVREVDTRTSAAKWTASRFMGDQYTWALTIRRADSQAATPPRTPSGSSAALRLS